jgi:putative transposase
MNTQESLLDLIDTGKPLEIKRALAVRMAMQGYSRSDIAELLDISIPFIDKWKAIFIEEGAESLKLNYCGSQGYLLPEQRQAIIDHIQSYDSISVDELREYIKSKYGIEYKTPKSYIELLCEADFSYKKTQKVNPKADDAQVDAKKKEIQNIIHENKDDIKNGSLIIWMQDECHQLHGDTCGYVWGPRGERLEVPMTNFRQRQTWYGAINCYTGQFFISDYDAGNTQNTINFVNKILQNYPLSRHIFVWDGASCHTSKEFKEYLTTVNAGLPESMWKVKCIRFAPNAPEQNPVEDIWLQAKNFVRKNFLYIDTFQDAVRTFRDFFSDRIFNFDKIKNYVVI